MAKKDWLACVLIGKEESGDNVGGDGGGKCWKAPKILHDDVSVIVGLQEPVNIIKMVAVHVFKGLQ